MNDMEIARMQSLEAWLQWCLDNCDNSPAWNFGEDATEKMLALLRGEDIPPPYEPPAPTKPALDAWEMHKTPLTDAEIVRFARILVDFHESAKVTELVPADFARDLERKLHEDQKIIREMLDEMLDRVLAAETDTQRYRWLKMQKNVAFSYLREALIYDTPSALDAAIDQFIWREQNKQQ